VAAAVPAKAVGVAVAATAAGGDGTREVARAAAG